MKDSTWITSSDLAGALVSVGVPSGQIVMVHARLSAFPWIVGGVEALLRALLAAAYRAGMPPFDPAVSEARRKHGRLPERIRTWPCACRSVHPEANLVAVGARARWLTASDLHDDPYGERSPLARLVEADATILLLGAPLDALTLVHHAEWIATAKPKRWVSYEMPIRHDGSIIWRRFHTIDTSQGAYDYQRITGESDSTRGGIRMTVEVHRIPEPSSGPGRPGWSCRMPRSRKVRLAAPCPPRTEGDLCR